VRQAWEVVITNSGKGVFSDIRYPVFIEEEIEQHSLWDRLYLGKYTILSRGYYPYSRGLIWIEVRYQVDPWSGKDKLSHSEAINKTLARMYLSLMYARFSATAGTPIAKYLSVYDDHPRGVDDLERCMTEKDDYPCYTFITRKMMEAHWKPLDVVAEGLDPQGVSGDLLVYRRLGLSWNLWC